MAGQRKTTTGFEDLMNDPTGRDGFFEYLKTNKNARSIFEGLLSEFRNGMGLQNRVAQVQIGDAAVAAAGFRPGQYVSARQRREAILAATDPDKAASDTLARLRFHGGVANGKWISNYDEWKAAGDTQHTNSKGEKIVTRSFGPPPRRPLTNRDVIMGTTITHHLPGPPDANGSYPTYEAPMRGSPGAVVRAMSRLAGGDYRGVRRERDGSITYTFGGDGNRADVRRDAVTQLNNSSNVSGEWLFDDEGRLKVETPLPGDSSLQSASKAGETMRKRGWLDAVFARAERAAMRGGRSRR